MARKKKSSITAAKRKVENAKARAEWRKLERLGVVKQRKRVDGKLPPIKITSYKKKRLKQLAPVLSGKATVVKLGPKALAAARAQGTSRIGRYAVVPNTVASREAARAGQPVRAVFDMPTRDAYNNALGKVVQLAENNPARKRAVNHRTIEKNISKLGSKVQREIARQKFDNWQQLEAWWDDFALENDFDDDLSPCYYH